ENIFEERVAKALNKLGVPSSKDVDALIARIDELNKNVQQLSAKAAASAKSGAPKTAAAKPARKSAPKSAKSAAKPATKRAATRKATAPVKTEAAGA
ncbi:MAG TPA: phasin family protein, partial [Burkholderiaceae bacterium]|nr:phasin family protein [Burkholderiaceae bacterium]